jgi:hypothetical protein
VIDPTLFDNPPGRVKQRGHAAPPGTGPEGKTCRMCRFYRSVRYHDGNYRKCGLMEHAWSHGGGTDIRASDPACRQFQDSISKPETTG